MENAAVEDWAAGFDELSDLIAATEDMNAFLEGLACLAARVVSHAAGARVECAVTLERRKRPRITGGSTDQMIVLERIGQRLREGPSIDALVSGCPVLVQDATSSPQWAEYCRALSAEGGRSTLALPLSLGEGEEAVLNFFTANAGVFSEGAVAQAVTFAELASKALRVALRITSLNELTDDLDAAMKSRSVINIACGVIIAQNGCTQDEAITILRKASSDRNQKLRDLARALVDGVGHQHARHVSDGTRPRYRAPTL